MELEMKSTMRHWFRNSSWKETNSLAYHFFVFELEETSSGNGIADDRLRLIQNAFKVIHSPKAFHINLVDVLSTRGTRREPSALRHHLQPAEGCPITRRMRQD